MKQMARGCNLVLSSELLPASLSVKLCEALVKMIGASVGCFTSLC